MAPVARQQAQGKGGAGQKQQAGGAKAQPAAKQGQAQKQPGKRPHSGPGEGAGKAGAGTGPAAPEGHQSKKQKIGNTGPKGGPAHEAAGKAGKAGKAGASAKGAEAPAAGAAAATAAAAAAGGAGGKSNWEALKARIGATGEGAKRKQQQEGGGKGSGKKPKSMGSNTGLTPVLALDCEMVGVGPDGTRSALARIALVNAEGNVLMDAYVRPKEAITDYRTKYSGIRPADLKGPGVLELEEVQARVSKMLSGRLLVGHGLTNDLQALLLDHPRKDIRDTSRYPPLMRAPAPGRKPKPRALRMLAAEELGLDIQSGEHSPVDDARAALYLYLRHKKDWEAAIKNGSIRRGAQAVKAARKAALGAAVAAAAAGPSAAAAAVAAAAAGPGAGVPGGAAAGREVLTPAQLRQLRQGRKIKGQAGAGKGGAAAGAGGGGIGKLAGKGLGGPSLATFDAEEIAELARAAASGAAAAATKGKSRSAAQAMAQAMNRDVRFDPMADL